MWYYLRARIDNIRLRVLRPNIQEHQTVDILCGLPEGSRISPTLFGIFVADLIHNLQTKFPHAVINLAPGLQHNGTTQIWIGGLLYVDEPHAHVHLPVRTASHAICLPGMERSKLYADQYTEDKKSWLSSRPPPSKKPVVASTDPAQPHPLSTSKHPSQPPPLALTSLLRYSNLNTEDSSSTPKSQCTSQLPKPFDAPHTASP